jgi:hypothetical protein
MMNGSALPCGLFAKLLLILKACWTSRHIQGRPLSTESSSSTGSPRAETDGNQRTLNCYPELNLNPPLMQAMHDWTQKYSVDGSLVCPHATETFSIDTLPESGGSISQNTMVSKRTPSSNFGEGPRRS